jgi:hypothetical protein
MQIRSTIIKLLLHYTPDELLGHIAHEIEQQAVSYANAGAPMRAFYLRAQVASLREAAAKVREIPYSTSVRYPYFCENGPDCQCGNSHRGNI